MTDAEKKYIVHQRSAGQRCADIARMLGISVNTVKSYCQRKNIAPMLKKGTVKGTICRHCGSAVNTLPHRKAKYFCSDTCRLAWWHAHRDMAKNAVDRRCQCCGQIFRTVREQKYCSQECYMKARYGGNGYGRNVDRRTV